MIGGRSQRVFFWEKVSRRIPSDLFTRQSREYFLQFLNAPEDWFAAYVRNGGKETIEMTGASISLFMRAWI